jgi:serine protease Do
MWRREITLKRLSVIALASVFMGTLMGESLDLFSDTRNQNLTGKIASAATQDVQELPHFVDLARELGPAVVNISTTQLVQAPQSFPRPLPSPFGEQDPFGGFWKRFFGAPFSNRGPLRQRSLGSGFIIDADGSILTNNHVIMNAEKIVVKLPDEREFEAKVIGNDPKTDIAVIKIDAKGSLPTAPLGDSKELQVGEWVMAIGNPFGLDRTVTSGIVSAKGRVIGAGPYDNFIQTDASINPGNSGGPLVNMEGEVVGVNTAIFTRSGGNIGIGFATPINLVKEILPELKTKGKVVRGWLGVTIQRVTPAIAESLGLEKPRGALVASVSNGGPADRGGIKVGDVLMEFDGKMVEESDDLPLVVARTPVGKEVQIKVKRGKEEVGLSVIVGELKEEEVVATAEGGEDLGLTVKNVTPQIAESLGLDRAEGVVIISIQAGSPAQEAGLRQRDIILQVDRKPIRDLSDFRNVVANVEKDKPVLFLVRRGETSLFLALRVAS